MAVDSTVKYPAQHIQYVGHSKYKLIKNVCVHYIKTLKYWYWSQKSSVCLGYKCKTIFAPENIVFNSLLPTEHIVFYVFIFHRSFKDSHTRSSFTLHSKKTDFIQKIIKLFNKSHWHFSATGNSEQMTIFPNFCSENWTCSWKHPMLHKVM